MNIYDPRYKQVENLPGEIWKDIPEFEDHYEISSEGRVRSKDRYIFGANGSCIYVPVRILSVNPVHKPNTVPCYGVTLGRSDKEKHHYCRAIKSLVGNAFLEKDDKCKHLVTIDDPLDFCVDNLIYVSYQEFKELYHNL